MTNPATICASGEWNCASFRGVTMTADDEWNEAEHQAAQDRAVVVFCDHEGRGGGQLLTLTSLYVFGGVLFAHNAPEVELQNDSELNSEIARERHEILKSIWPPRPMTEHEKRAYENARATVMRRFESFKDGEAFHPHCRIKCPTCDLTMNATLGNLAPILGRLSEAGLPRISLRGLAGLIRQVVPE